MTKYLDELHGVVLPESQVQAVLKVDSGAKASIGVIYRSRYLQSRQSASHTTCSNLPSGSEAGQYSLVQREVMEAVRFWQLYHSCESLFD